MNTQKNNATEMSPCKPEVFLIAQAFGFIRQLIKGQMGPEIKYALTLYFILFGGRVAMLLMYWKRVNSLSNVAPVFLSGLLGDISIILILLLPLVLHFIILGEKELRSHVFLITIYSLFTVLIGAFFEVAGLPFSIIFECRPNRIFFEYLAFPKEVLSTVIAGFPVSGLIIGTSMIAIPLILFSKVKYHMTSFLKSPRRRLTLTTMLYLVFFTIFSLPVITDWTKLITRSTVTNDRVLNSIAMNGISSSICGILTMLDRELDGSKFYGSMSESEVLERLSNYSSTTWHQRTTVGVGSKADRFHSLQSVPKSQTFPEKINLVIIIEESLSALFTGHLGGKNLTPELDKLVMEGLYCSRMYANGDRTVRALEAVTCGLLPTAGRSILKQKKIPDQFFSLGRVLKNEGYVTEFIYGGDKNFDYMWRFFTAIGFDHVYDEANNTKQDVFHGPWGICDSDLFERACDIFDSHKENPFASLILTTSIHDPFTYPENIGPVSGNPATPENAVRYADKALGNFFARAKKSEWYKNTIFVFVSDHNLRVSGEGLIPVEAFHIPSFIIGPGVPVKEHKEICHQIDLVPTILNLLDVRTNVPLMGSDLLSVPEDPRATNRAFIATGYTAALFNNKSMVVLNPGSPPEYYVKDGSSFTPSKTLNTELAKDCQAFALSTNVLFNSPVYTVK